MRLPVLTAGGGAGWEAALVLELARGGHGITAARRCVDVVELLAVAASGQGRAALIDAGLPRLDRDAVERLVAAGVVPVGVVRRGDVDAEDHLHTMGVRFTVPADAGGAVVASVVEQAVEAGTADPAAATAVRTFGDTGRAAVGAGPSSALGEPVAQRVARGAVIAVWGPAGAPGRTTVAVTLADELARLGPPVLLVDADVYGGVVAATLGLLDESPGLAAACRLATAGRLDAGGLAGLAWRLSDSLRVLTGLPRADRWPELRPGAVEAVLATARELADFTVVDCGFSLEADEELSFDAVAPRRNGATLTALDAADVVVAVGAADPIGMQRLVRGLTELREAEIATPVWVVLNKVRRGVVPGDPVAELAAALQRFAGQQPAAYLPADGGALDAALAAGQTLAEARPGSPLRAAVVELARALAGGSEPTAGRRRAGRRHRAGARG